MVRVVPGVVVVLMASTTRIRGLLVICFAALAWVVSALFCESGASLVAVSIAEAHITTEPSMSDRCLWFDEPIARKRKIPVARVTVTPRYSIIICCYPSLILIFDA